METKKVNQKSEGVLLNLDCIRLTQDLIEEINFIQVGGFNIDGKVEDSRFDNAELDCDLDKLNRLFDFFIELYDNKDFTDSEIIMDHLCLIRYIKNHFEKFRVPYSL
jgi:hypothetical protein